MTNPRTAEPPNLVSYRTSLSPVDSINPAPCGFYNRVVLPARQRETAVVLVVEDDPSARLLYRAALSQGEFHVRDVGDGVEALRYPDSHQPAAVVLDLGLPRLHGRDVLKELAAHDVRVPVVVVTGTNEQLDDQQVASVLRKPISGDLLLTTVRRAINTRRVT